MRAAGYTRLFKDMQIIGCAFALLFLVLFLVGCDDRREPPKAYPAVVIGSGCNTWGCVSHARILRGPNIHRTCKFYDAKLNARDTVLVWIDRENQCRLY